MSKRDRHLKQRLDELFSQAPEPAETQPAAPAAEPEAPSAEAAGPVELAAATALELPYLKAMIDQLPLPAYLKDHEHTWMAVNTALAQLIGHTPETLLGHTDKEQADTAWQLDDRVLDSGEPEETQETIPLPDGRIITRRTRRTPLRGAGQKAHYVMGVVEDNVASTPVQAQSPVTTAADASMFRDLFENTDALIQGVTNEGAFVFTNRAWREALGYSEEELARLNLFDVIHPDSQPHCMALFQRIMEGEHAQWIEARFVGKDGRTIDVEGSTSCSFKDGQPIITRGVFHDVSERKRLEQDLQRLLAVESKRAVQLQTAAEVSKAAGTVLDADELLPFVVNLIQQRFNLYYVGLFLVDDTRQNAILRAGTGEAGQVMLNRRHRLPLDDRSMIGWCIQRQMPRIALDVGKDAVHFNNPDLPDTRSELALPLVSRGQVLGAVTVQSKESAAFSEQDIAILQTMSDQVATTIANAQLFEQAGQARQQAETRLRETQFLQSVGQAVSSSLDLSSVLEVVMGTLQRELGFTHNALALVDRQAETVSIPRASGTAAGLQGLTRTVEQLQNDIILDVLRTGQIEVIDGWDDRFDREIYERQGHAELVRAFVPLRLRGESIGLLEVGYRRTERASITPDEVRLLGGLADQIAIAVGNARLFDETQRRVTELQALNDISQLVVSQHERDSLQQAGETFCGFLTRALLHCTKNKRRPSSFVLMDEGQSTQEARPLGKVSLLCG
jgi:PAS domain S-box-containing protein